MWSLNTESLRQSRLYFKTRKFHYQSIVRQINMIDSVMPVLICGCKIKDYHNIIISIHSLKNDETKLIQMNFILDYKCIDWMEYFFLFQMSILVYLLSLIGSYALHCIFWDSKQSKLKSFCTGMKCLFVAYEDLSR